MNPAASVALAALFWYGLEALLALVAGWPLNWLSPLAWIARDVLLPLLWAEGWRGDNFVWRGNAMSVDESALQRSPVRDRPRKCECGLSSQAAGNLPQSRRNGGRRLTSALTPR